MTTLEDAIITDCTLSHALTTMKSLYVNINDNIEDEQLEISDIPKAHKVKQLLKQSIDLCNIANGVIQNQPVEMETIIKRAENIIGANYYWVYIESLTRDDVPKEALKKAKKSALQAVKNTTIEALVNAYIKEEKNIDDNESIDVSQLLTSIAVSKFDNSGYDDIVCSVISKRW